MDSLSIDGIELSTHIGVPEEERKKEQRLLVSIELFLDLSAAGRTDDVTQSVDYYQVTLRIRTLAQQERKTIESFAEDIAQMILKEFQPAGGVKVSVWKFPMPGVRAVCATIERKYDASTVNNPASRPSLRLRA